MFISEYIFVIKSFRHVGAGGEGKPPQYFEIWHFSINYLHKKLFSYFRVVKMQFCHFWPLLQNYFWPTPGHKCRSRQIFGRAKDFCPMSPKLAQKVLCDFCQQIFSHKRQFLVWPPKKGFMCFSAIIEHHILKSNKFGRHFCPDFQRFWPDFNKSKLRRCAFTPCTPPSTPLPWKIHFWPLPGKKFFRYPCSGVHAHLPKSCRGTWPEKVSEPLH